MKLYFHPVSTTSRPVALFAADHGIARMKDRPTWARVNEAFYVNLVQPNERRAFAELASA